MTQMSLFQTAKFSPPDTHANPLVSPGLEEEQRMTDISGQKYFPLLKPNDPLGQFSKTFMATSLWVSMKCFLIWKGKATPQGRLLFQLLPLTHPTDGIEFGSSEEIWATPNTMDHLPQRSEEALKKQATTARKGRKKPANLREQVNPDTVKAWKEAQQIWKTPVADDIGIRKKKYSQGGTALSMQVAQEPTTWPTPIASTGGPYKNHKGDKKKVPSSGNPLATAVAMWPTPRARDWKMSGDVASWKESNIGDTCLRRAVAETDETSGSLNPQWVEWLMGYPVGWTDLED